MAKISLAQQFRNSLDQAVTCLFGADHVSIQKSEKGVKTATAILKTGPKMTSVVENKGAPGLAVKLTFKDVALSRAQIDAFPLTLKDAGVTASIAEISSQVVSLRNIPDGSALSLASACAELFHAAAQNSPVPVVDTPAVASAAPPSVAAVHQAPEIVEV